MTRALLLAALASAFPVLGCDVATVDEVPSSVAQNQCRSDSDCPGGDCVDGQCRSRNGTFKTLLFEVTPPSDSTPFAGLQFLKRIDDLAAAGGDLPVSLDVVSQIVGELKVRDRKCVPKFDVQGTELASSGDGSVPGVISLTPSAQALGVFSPPAIAQTALIDSTYFGFSLNVPPGDYDIYVEPQHQPDQSCIVPPQLSRARSIGGGSLALQIQLNEPSSFEFHVTWPLADGGLNSWQVDMLDPVSGRVISNRAQLALGTGGKSDYVATLDYYPVIGDATAAKAQELVRLSPPDGVVALTVLLARSASACSMPIAVL